MAERQPPTATHQSWTGSVAVYLAKPPRVALYPGQNVPSNQGAAAGTAGGATGVGGPNPCTTVAAATDSQAPHHDQPVAGRQQSVLPSAPNKAALRGTWMLSRGSATLTAALSAAGQGEFTVRVQLEGATLWVQDLFGGGGEVRLLAPGPPQPGGPGGKPGSDTATAPAPAAAAAGAQQPWLLLLLPPQSAQPEGSAAAATSAANAADVPAPAPQQPQPALQTHPSWGSGAEPGNTAPGRAGTTATAAAATQPMQPSASAPPAVCFRFNSPGEGRAFQSLLQAAERVKAEVVRRAEERQREAELRRAEDEERRRRRREAREQPRLQAAARAQQAAAVAAGAAAQQRQAVALPPQACGDEAALRAQPSLGLRAGLGSRWSDSDIRAAIERYLLEPGFQALVERVEAVWDEMEEQAERQLQAQAQQGPGGVGVAAEAAEATGS